MHSKYDEHSEAWKELFDDFIHFEETGFKPFEKSVGGAEHYPSRGDYWKEKIGLKDSFRSLAKRVAMKACAMLPDSTLMKYGYERRLDKVTNDKAENGKQAPKKARDSEDNDKTLAAVETNIE